MKRIAIILLLLSAALAVGAQDNKFNPNAVKVRLLKNRQAQLKIQVDSVKASVFEGEDPIARERWNYVKDSTILVLRSEMTTVAQEIKEYE